MHAAIKVEFKITFELFPLFCSTWLPFCYTRNLLLSLWHMEEFKSCWKYPGLPWLLLVFLCASITLPTTRTLWKGYKFKSNDPPNISDPKKI